MTDTLLVITGMGVPLYSARGLHQTLKPIEQAKQYRRDINGTLHDISFSQMQKYETEITCDDQRAPALDGVWPGMEVTISCVEELTYPVGGSPHRTVVSGSSVTESGFVRYRPQLDMIIADFNVHTDEYGAVVGWTLTAQEK